MSEKKLPYERLLQICQEYIECDLYDAESEYVLQTLRETCGCSDEEIEALGFVYLLDMERGE